MSVRPSVHPSVPSYFRTPNMAVFEGEKSSTDIVNNGTMSEDEVVASDVPRGTCLMRFRIFIKVCDASLVSYQLNF